MTTVDAALRCPVCRGGLERRVLGPAASLRCARRHTFDVARQGYVHLAPGGTRHEGDPAELVALRADFLTAGHYDFLSEALAVAARPYLQAPDALVVEAGAGTAQNLARVLDAAPEAAGIAFDVSKPALRRAARAHPRAVAALVDTWGPWPLVDACAEVVLDVFAPRNAAEFRRVLAPDGALIVVTPLPEHLTELVRALGLLDVAADKAERVEGTLAAYFERVDRTEMRRVLSLSPAEAAALARMGPSGFHRSAEAVQAVLQASGPTIAVTAAVALEVWRIPEGLPDKTVAITASG